MSSCTFRAAAKALATSTTFFFALLQGDHTTLCNALRYFISRQAAEQLPGDPMLTAMADEQQWQHSEAVGIPQQHDGVNCGVFALVFADCLSVGFPLSDCHLNGNFTEARAHLAHALLQVSTHGAHGLGELVHFILETCATVEHLTTHCCLAADCRMHLSCCSSCWQPLTLLQWLLTEGLFMVIKVGRPCLQCTVLGR
jgi:hypothetical protein